MPTGECPAVDGAADRGRQTRVLPKRPTHGLCAKIVSLPESDQVELQTVVETVEQEWRPAAIRGSAGRRDRDRLWRVRRAFQIEARYSRT